MPRTHTLGIRLSASEQEALRVLRELRGFEGSGALIRVLIREELCRKKELVYLMQERELATVRPAVAGTD